MMTKYQKIFGAGPRGLLISSILFGATYLISKKFALGIIFENHQVRLVAFVVSIIITIGVVAWSLKSIMRYLIAILFFCNLGCSKLADTFNNEDDVRSKTTNSGTSTVDNFLFSNALASVSDLTECTSSNQGQIYYISSTEEFRGCNGSSWEVTSISQAATDKSKEYVFMMNPYCVPTDGSFVFNTGFSDYDTGEPFLASRDGRITKAVIKLINFANEGNPVAISSDMTVEVSVSKNSSKVDNADYIFNLDDSNSVNEVIFSGSSEISFSAGDTLGMRLQMSCSGVDSSIISGRVVMNITYEYN